MIERNCVRVIARLDIKGPNLVKGIKFDGFRVLGTPERFSEIYYRQGIDELIFQDTVASLYQRNSLAEIVERTARNCFIPITVVGGLRSMKDIEKVLRAGADKVAINTAAIENPSLLKESVKAFGSQCIVSSIEAHPLSNGRYEAWVNYGREPTQVDVFDWAKQAVDLGVGEILLIAIDRDGTGTGFDIELTRRIALTSPVPVIASGGAGTMEDFSRVIKEGLADAVSAASMFHYHYAQAPESLWMSYNEPKLRMGAPIDSGCVEFIKSGYAGFKDIFVKPASISQIKECMRDAGIFTRGFQLEKTSV